MSYCFDIGTTSYAVKPSVGCPAGTVEYTGSLCWDEHELLMVWDAGLGNVRCMNTDELLQRAKDLKLQELEREQVRRMATYYQFMGKLNGSFVDWLDDLWLSLTPSARGTLQGSLQDVKKIRVDYEAAVVVVNGLTTITAVEAYDVAIDPAWRA